jgi:acyl-CoA reductase-like NAD-dependent aldehyde dehydrogenase
MCIECGVTAQEWAHTHGSDPNLPDNYRPMCRKCHRKYDGWGEMISKAKTAYWATIPPEERNRDPETRRKNSEAQKARWAAMSPERRKSVIENAAEGQRRRNRSMRGAE